MRKLEMPLLRSPPVQLFFSRLMANPKRIRRKERVQNKRSGAQRIRFQRPTNFRGSISKMKLITRLPRSYQ
jgi:hypothetical protein